MSISNLKSWSERRVSNPRPSPWQGDALPLSYSRERKLLYQNYQLPPPPPPPPPPEEPPENPLENPEELEEDETA